jgi:hypothetical protein
MVAELGSVLEKLPVKEEPQGLRKLGKAIP